MKRLKFNTFHAVMLVIVFVIISALVWGVAIHGLKKQMQTELIKFQVAKMETAKQELKNYVDIAYTLLEHNYLALSNKDLLIKTYGYRVKNISQVVKSILVTKDSEVKAGKMTLETAQQEALNEISSIRYEPSGYVWINDTGRPYPKMIMHPLSPELNGKVLNDPKFNCALGKNQNLFQAAVEISLQSGGGFVDYIWPKKSKTGVSVDSPKLSYVQLFRPWNWVIGTGVYLDDVTTDIIETDTDLLNSLRYDYGVGYFFVVSNELPYPKLLIQPILPGLVGKVMDSPQYTTRDKKNQFFSVFVKLARSQGEGFVEYNWPQPTRSGELVETAKISYIRLFKPLGWIIGSGMSLDDIEKDLVKKKAEQKIAFKTFITHLAMAYAISIMFMVLILIIIRYLKHKHRMKNLKSSP